MKWSRYRSSLPSDSEIQENTLTLKNLRLEDTDRYFCVVESPYGTTSDYIDLQVRRK